VGVNAGTDDGSKRLPRQPIKGVHVPFRQTAIQKRQGRGDLTTLGGKLPRRVKGENHRLCRARRAKHTKKEIAQKKNLSKGTGNCRVKIW